MKQVVVAVLGLLVITVGCRKRAEVPLTPSEANRVSTRVARLYFESPQMLLVSESRSLALPESPSAALPLIVRELMKGPADEQALRVWPEDTIVRGAFLLPGGTAVIDLGGETLTAGWEAGSHHELMAAYSLVQTVVANLREVRQVRILVNGSTAETLAGHLATSRSLRPFPGLVHPAAR